MGLKMNNVQLSPRGRTTSIYSSDGENWFTADGDPIDLKDVHYDSAGADLVLAITMVGFVTFICWVFLS